MSGLPLPIRSALFLPASNPRAIAKARGLPCDLVILDLEDAVKAEDKDAARAAAVAAIAEGFGERLAAIRINGVGTDEHAADLAAAAGSRADLIVVPKVETPQQAADCAAPGKPILAMIETPAGLLAATAIAAVPGVAGLIAGTNDLAAALRLPDGADRAGLVLALQTIVLAARAAGGIALDGVWNRLDDEEGLARQCRDGTRVRIRRQDADPPEPDRCRQPRVRPERGRAGGCPSADRGGKRRGGAVPRAHDRGDARRLGRTADRDRGPNTLMRLFLAILLASLPAAAPARISEGALRRHIAVLADDKLAGRKPGTPGGLAAEHYIAAQFGRAGLAPGAAGGTWYQPVRLVPKQGPEVIADNVIGRLAGTDPKAGVIVVMAHWDHLGLCAPAGAPDRICNGAVDNASGVAVLIEIARAMAHGTRPKRSLIFVATTGEEMGLLGAKAFVADPPVPLETIAAGLNLDTSAVAPRGSPVTTIPRGTILDPQIESVAAALGRTVDRSDAANALLTRQDGWALMQAGVPAVLMGGAYRGGLQHFLSTRYHHPDDDLHGIELGGAAEDADLHVALLRRLANPPSPGLDSAGATH